MTTFEKHEPGTFCWIELHTSDGVGAKKFYLDLFGWTPNEIPMGEGPAYVIGKIDGRDAAAMMEEKEVPTGWLSYVCVDSVDDAAAKVQELGGKLAMPPFDVFDLGRMVVVSDPEGAHFALWQPKSHIGVKVKNEHGSLCWNELQTRQRDKAKEFYTKLFGWTTKDSPEYIEIHAGGQGIGGLMTMQPQVPAEVPAHWLPYFWVNDVDGAVQKASGSGGTTLVPPMDIFNVGRFAVIRDPQGAVFAVFKANM